MPAPSGAGRSAGVGGWLRGRARGFTHSVGESLEIVAAGQHRVGIAVEADDLPAAWRGEPPCVLLAEVVGVWLGVGGQRAHDRRRVGVDVSERRDRGPAASGPRAAAQWAHGGDRTRREPSYQLPAPKQAPSTYASAVTGPRPTRRRDRRGRGPRGPLAPRTVPLTESP